MNEYSFTDDEGRIVAIPLVPIGTPFTFDSPYEYGPTGWTEEQFAARKGTPARVVEYIVAPGPDVDEECLPMYRVAFDDGVVITAWPEEVIA